MTPDQQTVITNTIDFVKQTLADAETGHDWWHIYRVWKMSQTIAQSEEVDIFIVELGALLHDIADSKFHDGDDTIGPKLAGEFLGQQKVNRSDIDHVKNIIANISFSGQANIQRFKSPELDVVQDADRLDAIGAIGIARTFNYGGYKNIVLYDPDIKPKLNMTKQEYQANKGTTINHFYEKLLLLKDRMNTKTGRQLAEQRHLFMQQYLDQFYAEWEGQR